MVKDPVFLFGENKKKTMTIKRKYRERLVQKARLRDSIRLWADLLTPIVLIATAIAIFWQSCETKKSVEMAKQSIQATRDCCFLSNRAWIDIDLSHMSIAHQGNMIWLYHIGLHNSGRTPADQVYFKIIPSCEFRSPIVTIFGAAMYSSIPAGEWKFPETEGYRIPNECRRDPLYVNVFVSYGDCLGRHHYVRAEIRYDRESKEHWINFVERDSPEVFGAGE